MKPMTHFADKFQLKNRGVEKPVEKPDVDENISPINLIRTRVEFELVNKKSRTSKKLDASKRKITRSARIRIPDLLKLNQDIKQQQNFDGSHLSHFMKAMEDHSVEAKKAVMKPACDGLTWYITLFDCER